MWPTVSPDVSAEPIRGFVHGPLSQLVIKMTQESNNAYACMIFCSRMDGCLGVGDGCLGVGDGAEGDASSISPFPASSSRFLNQIQKKKSAKGNAVSPDRDVM